jgi:hypothetical protein
LVLGIPNSGNNTVTFVQFVLNVPEILNSTALVYPNPASTQLIIELNENSAAPQLISVYDLTGKWVQSLGAEAFVFDIGKITLNCETLQSGAYFLHLHGVDNMEMIRVVVQK